MATRVARLSILDSYGVRWSRETFARDLLQNFFDSTADFRAIALDVGEEAGVVEIRGPATFDIDLLAYIGATTKNSGRTVGGFGEGFKICALVGARDFGLTITAGTGAHEIEVFFDPVPLGRELCYRVTEREEPLAGSYVRLQGCDEETLDAFADAPSMFRHPDNPELSQPLVIDGDQGIGVYRTPQGPDGEIYYRRQLRGAVRFYGTPARALTLAHDGIIDELEGDRDRRDIRAEPIARAIGDKLPPEELHRVILELMPQWRYGHEVLNGFLAAGVARKLTYAWPPRWLARSYRAPGLAQFAERQGYSIALATFAELGMPTPEQHYKELQTRQATPLERARFQVVADLYAELHGTPAKTTELEVFDLAGSAVAGQHLGSKVIIGAELIAGGFDAAGGTILHELSHEAGGEEDVRFLRRLTNLLGAALREPEKIREARRRYAEARPSRARRKAAPKVQDTGKAYMPEQSTSGDDMDGVVCTVVMPPGFPPAERIVETIRAAAKEAGVPLWVNAAHVNGPIGAVTWQAPGIPTVYIGGIDAGGAPADTTPGYRLRTYGPDSKDLCPDVESLRAALKRAKELDLTGRDAVILNRELTENHVERVRRVLGIQLPAPRASKKPSARAQRDELLHAYLRGFVDDSGGFDLKDAFPHGQHAACGVWVRAARKDRRPASVLFDEISDRLNCALRHAYAMEVEDADYDDADAFEREAMEAALGAAVSAYALGADEADAKARAGAAFALVRAATTRVLDLDVTVKAKDVILTHAMKCAGLGWDHRRERRTFDGERFQEAVDHAVAEAVRIQHRVDEAGGHLSEYELKAKLDPLAEDPRDVRNRARSQRKWARWARATHAVKAAYERALSTSGSEITAAQASLDAAARLIPEARR